MAIQRLVGKFRFRYAPKDGDDKATLERKQERSDALSRILWYSIPCVYVNWQSDFSQAEKLIRSNKAKKKRVNKILTQMFNAYSELHFVTLTFDDNALTSTTAETRHRYVSRYLDANTDYYVANVDYGKTNGREHFHAVVAWRGDIPLETWKYGFVNDKKVRMQKADKGRISAYISKLTNHSGKTTSGKIFHKRGEMWNTGELPF